MKKFLKAVGWFLAFCLVFELVLRLFGYGNYTIYRPDDQLLWVPEPGRTVTVVNHLPITINDQGFRYASNLTQKPKDELRIIAFGDSSTQGWGVDDNSHYSAVLEKMLNNGACHEHAQVVSAGVNAYPNSLVATKLQMVVENPATRPDIAIEAYSYNSNFEKLPLLQGEQRKAFLRRVEVKAWVRRSAIYNFVIEDLLRRVAYYQLRHIVMKGSLATIHDADVPDVPQFTSELQRSLDVSRANGTQLVLLLLGSQNQQEPDHPFQKAMIEFAQKNNVPLINMIPIVREKDQVAMFMDPAHPTNIGHQVIAEQLLKSLQALPAFTAACQGTAPAVNVANTAGATAGAQ